jgi:hypothetical protein
MCRHQLIWRDVPPGSTLEVRVSPATGGYRASADGSSRTAGPERWTDAELRAGKKQWIGPSERLFLEIWVANEQATAVDIEVTVRLRNPSGVIIGSATANPVDTTCRLEPGGDHQVVVDIVTLAVASGSTDPRPEAAPEARPPMAGRPRPAPSTSRRLARVRPSSAPPPATSKRRAATRSKPEGAAGQSPEPVFLGVTAPRAVKPRSTFVARFAAYVKASEDAVRSRLESLSRDPSHVHLGFTPNQATHWKVGTPVTVRLSGDGFTADPGQARFEWSGQENLLGFVVKVSDDLAEGIGVLTFEASIEGVPVALIPLEIEVGPAPDATPRRATASPARTAFASYASADRARVMDKLGALSGYDATLDIFTDCLDLRPGEVWKERLETEIPQRDIFLLFWSRAAASSKWVGWEWQTALAKKGVVAIHPMPLEAPQLAPPPPELSSLHFNDRYLMVRDAEAARQLTKP